MSNLTVWDALKAYLRGQIICYTANLKRRSVKERMDLSSRIKEIDKQFAQTKDPKLFRERMELKAKLDFFLTHSVECMPLKDKAQFYMHGDKPNKLLANQLRGARAKQSIPKIRMPCGRTTLDHLQINSMFRDFYSQLYTSEAPVDQDTASDFLNMLDIPTLPPDLRKALDEPISNSEITSAISSMQSGKSPGPDGFSAEFFAKFSSLLSPQLCLVLSDSFWLGSLPKSFTEAYITLIAKKGKDPADCASYRPNLSLEYRHQNPG